MSPAAQGQLEPTPSEGASQWRWRRSERALWREVLDDVVVVDGAGLGEPFALAGGARLWSLLAEAVTLDDLAGSFGGACALADLLEDLRRRGVVERLPR